MNETGLVGGWVGGGGRRWGGGVGVGMCWEVIRAE